MQFLYGERNQNLSELSCTSREVVAARFKLHAALTGIWFVTDQMCSKKLIAILPLWLPFYAHPYSTLSRATAAQIRVPRPSPT